MIIRSRAPLRIGLAGGGTDVSPYSELYGGAILNSTISLYVYVTLETTDDNKVSFNSLDLDESKTFEANNCVPIDHPLALFAGVYNKMVSSFNNNIPISCRLTSYVDVPKGSGLGTSSTICVALIGAFIELLQLELDEYEIAHLAYDIERIDLNMSGGKQDQYAATFGGVNYMEFGKKENVFVNPLRVKLNYLNELEHNLLLYYTGTSRLSSKIIEQQKKAFITPKSKSIDAAHEIKQQSILMKKALLKGDIDKIGEILDTGWKFKKEMATGITNPVIEDIYNTAKKYGATGGKISGAGGGGYMILYCPYNTRYPVMKALKSIGGKLQNYKFEKKGLTTWKINQ